MKQIYEKPSVEIVELDTNTVMMADSVSTELGDTPSTPDARNRRGTWGNLWYEE